MHYAICVVYTSHMCTTGHTHTQSERTDREWEGGTRARAPFVSRIYRGQRVGNLKKLISAIVSRLQSRFVFAFSDLFSQAGPPCAPYAPHSWRIFQRGARACVRLCAHMVTEFDLSNTRVAFNVNMIREFDSFI